MLNDVIKFVQKSFNNRSTSLKHFDRTLFWVKKLKPDYDEAILIAAYAHDIERSLWKISMEEKFKNKEINDSRHLKKHSLGGANIIMNFLDNKKYNKKDIKRIYNMIRYHEKGRDKESKLIMDADSISYLENNAIRHINDEKGLSKEKIKNKIDWMYKRIYSKKGKQFAAPLYKKALDHYYKILGG